MIDNYSNKYNKFPQVSEFIEAIREVGRESPEQTNEDLEGRKVLFTCQICRGIGRFIDEKKSPGGVEVFCQCEKGQRLYDNRQSYFEARRNK